MTQENKRDVVRMEYLCELVAVQGESLAKNLRELADISERCGFTPEPLASLRNFADAVDAVCGLSPKNSVQSLANKNGGEK